MNTLESYSIMSPTGKEEECAKFVIDDITMPYVLTGVASIGFKYTFSCWIKSESSGSVTVGGLTIDTPADWGKYSTNFVAGSHDFAIFFNTIGTYYIYHPQLETGNTATDWTPNPDDVDDKFASTDQAINESQNAANNANDRVSTVEASLKLLSDSVVTLTSDEEGNTSVLTQQGTGWTFSLGNLENTVEEALDSIVALTEDQEATLLAIDTLKSSVDEHSSLTDYIVVTEFNGQPCIELGEVGGAFKLRITNTEMYFIVDDNIRTTVTNQKMVVDAIEVVELQQGGFAWVLHGSGDKKNLGLMWKEATS